MYVGSLHDDSVKNRMHHPPDSRKNPSSGPRRQVTHFSDDSRKAQETPGQQAAGQKPKEQHRDVKEDALLVGERRQVAQDMVFPEKILDETRHAQARAAYHGSVRPATMRKKSKKSPQPGGHVVPASQRCKSRGGISSTSMTGPLVMMPRPQARAASNHQPRRKWLPAQGLEAGEKGQRRPQRQQAVKQQ